MREQVLTARKLYRFLAVGVGRPSVCIPFLSKRMDVTQTEFWWCFLAAGIPESPLLPYFEPRKHPPRALSNLMNRTVPHSMPVKLYRALEDNLDPEKLLHITVWTAFALDRDMNPLSLHAALTTMEDAIVSEGSDAEFAELYDFFVSLRPAGQDAELVHQKKLFLQAALRFSMLGLHALYGDRMIVSTALTKLRACRYCDPAMLWDAASSFAPRVNDGEGLGWQPSLRGRQYARESVSSKPAEKADPVPALTSIASTALPPEEVRAAHGGEGAGWYVVANWLDFDIYVNDVPRPTYDDAHELGKLSNGTLVYVLNAEGYQGLHASGGVWGSIWWHGVIAWIPMNLMIRIDGGGGGDLES